MEMHSSYIDATNTDQLPPRSAALTAGLGLLAMAIVAPVAAFGLLPKGHLLGAAAIFLGVAVLDVIVGLALHACVGAHARRWSLVAATLRIVYAVLLAAAVRHLVISPSPSDFEREWNIGLGVFGLHLLALGVVISGREGWLRALGVLVLAAGAGYAIDCVGMATTGHAPGLAKITFVGEVALMFWLLWRGVRARPSPRP
jgi:hypothetical protein